MSTFGIYIFVFSVLPTCFTLDNALRYAADTLEDTHGKIIHASLLFRHGDRAVNGIYPNDPYPTTLWPQGLGQLTKKGKQRAYDLGRWFRERYGPSLLPNGFRYDLIATNSTSIDRTIMSAELVLAGLLPPSADEMWAENGLQWQPASVYTISFESDNLLTINVPCDRLNLEIEKLDSVPEIRNLYNKYADVFQYVFRQTGLEFPPDLYSLFDITWDIYDTLTIEITNNLTLPSWAKKIYPEPLKTMAEKRFELYAFTYEMRKIRAGNLLGSMVADMQQKRRDPQFTQNLHLYSAHDTTLAPFLLLLQAYNGLVPPYSSTVIVELRMKDQDYVVTILYRNSSDVPPHILRIPECDNICTLDEFVRVTEHLISKDWDADCRISIFDYLRNQQFVNILAVIFALFIICFSITIICGAILEKRRKNYVPV